MLIVSFRLVQSHWLPQGHNRSGPVLLQTVAHRIAPSPKDTSRGVEAHFGNKNRSNDLSFARICGDAGQCVLQLAADYAVQHRDAAWSWHVLTNTPLIGLTKARKIPS